MLWAGLDVFWGLLILVFVGNGLCVMIVCVV